MTTFKRLLTLLLALALCFALCACGSEDPTPSESPSPSPSESPSADPDESQSSQITADLTQTMFEFSSGLKDGDAALTVNGVEIPNEQFLYWLSYYCSYMDYYYYQYGMVIDFTAEDARLAMLDNAQSAVVYFAVLREMCAEAGITVTAEQEEELRTSLDATVEASFGGDYDLMYQSYGLTAESLEQLFFNDYLYINYLDQVIPAPTAEEAEQYVTDAGIFGVKHILLMTATAGSDGSITRVDGAALTNDDGSAYTGTVEEYNAAQKALAEDLVSRLQAAEDQDTLFTELMNTYSEDSGLSTNPDGYTFTAEDSLVGGFREATLELEPGEISGVVETDYGYHILLRLPIDAAAYSDTLRNQTLTDTMTQRAEGAEVVVSDGISALNVDDFYTRYATYYNAIYEQLLALAEQDTGTGEAQG